MRPWCAVQLSIIVPTYNEAPNVSELVRRVSAAVEGIDAEVIFVDDSTDATPETVREVAATAPLPVRLIHREKGKGGLGGAVLEGFAAAESDVCVVIDGDLQHPPEDIPALWHRYARGDVDIVVASRYASGGTAGGLADRTRVFVSKISTALTRAMFPIRLKDVSDPMTGFFLVDRRVVDPEALTPRGFKILLEILARTNVRIAEVPFEFADRHAGESKASMRQGLHFLTQLTALRFGKMSLFAFIGALGAVVEPRDHVGSHPRRRGLHRRGDHRGRDDDHRQLPAAGALRLPGHARRGIRCRIAVREVVRVQQRRGAHPHPDHRA